MVIEYFYLAAVFVAVFSIGVLVGLIVMLPKFEALENELKKLKMVRNNENPQGNTDLR